MVFGTQKKTHHTCIFDGTQDEKYMLTEFLRQSSFNGLGDLKECHNKGKQR